MSYKVIFYREIVNSYGRPFNASVYTTEVGTAASMDEAAAAAIEAFERDRALSCWQALAHGYSVTHEAKDAPIAADRAALARVAACPGPAGKGTAVGSPPSAIAKAPRARRRR